MFSRRLKTVYFALEGINAFATAYYFYYLFFFLRDQFGFGNAQNLGVCALSGFVYMFAAWFGGRFSQRAGYFASLQLGFSLMGASLLWATFMPSLVGQMVLLVTWTFGMSFTWPALEALASEREAPARLQRMIGIYNVVWAGSSALAYFVGGALMEILPARSLFWFPALLHGVQLIIVFAVKQSVGKTSERAVEAEPGAATIAAQDMPPPDLKLPTKAFLRMAWLANPFAYVAINAAVPVIPALARELHLTTMQAGFFCSVWFFARLFTFALLWRWTGWHYRFRWLVTAFGLMIGCFAIMLLVRQMVVIVLAQIGFGFGIGLIYYSSLFYSMDVGDTKGEHGGIHEAAIGSGIFGGAALGAAGNYALGAQAGGTWLVSAVLLAGLLGLLLIRWRGTRQATR